GDIFMSRVYEYGQEDGTFFLARYMGTLLLPVSIRNNEGLNVLGGRELRRGAQVADYPHAQTSEASRDTRAAPGVGESVSHPEDRWCNTQSNQALPLVLRHRDP